MEAENRTSEVLKVAKQRLLQMNINYDLLTPKEQKYIERIETAVTAVFDRELQAIEYMSGNSVSVKGISKATGISRQTFYNNPLLMKYIDFCAKEFAKIDVSAGRNGDSEEIHRLNEEIAKLQARDVEYMEMKLQLSDAKREIQRLKEQIELERNGISYDFSGRSPRIGKIVKLNSSKKIVSWNVNGLAACAEKGFFSEFQKWDADIVCLQETKLSKERICVVLPGYEQFWNFAERPGYSGTAIFCKEKPITVSMGLGIPKFDCEGRLINAEFKDFYVVNCYSPTSQEDLIRLPYRMEWETALRKHMAALSKNKPVILCGDLNVAHTDIDAEYSVGKLSAGISNDERNAMDALLADGYCDVFRELHPDTYHKYSWWPYANDSRIRNVGLRLDYFITSKSLLSKIKDMEYLTSTLGSDHCPLVMTIQR